MCPNRVEELEARVQELEASVEGLTDELVECKVRIRELEDAVAGDGDLAPGGLGSAGDEADESAQSPDPAAAAGPADGGEVEESQAGDKPMPEDPETQDNAEESETDSGSDIIVA